MTDEIGAPGPWQSATVTSIREETPTAKTFGLQLASPACFLAGQHYIVRLTAPDGYTASRSYSVASAPDGSPLIEITVERLPGGEVSEFLHDEVVSGDELEVRGPIGGWFVWRGKTPAILIGGGSGIVPLMAMLRLARRSGTTDLVRMIVSVRTPNDLYYKDELTSPEATIVYTLQGPENGRPVGRLTQAYVAAAVLPDAVAYICGSSPFADAASALASEAGVTLDQIRIERFGPSG